MPKNIPAETLTQLYTTMLMIRSLEQRVSFVYPEQEMKCPVHLCTGQEAIAAGVCAHLTKEDTIFSTHRSHGHCIAKGMDLNSMVAEFYGKSNGCSRGRGGSMHLVDVEHGIPGTTAIVGGCIPLAVGAALSSVLRGQRETVSVAFFGDGAMDEGSFHESLNFASLKKLPVLFVCENNFYATNSPQNARQPEVKIASRAAGYGMPGIEADGNDVLAVYHHAGEAVRRARSGKGPTLLEFTTYRWNGHVGPTPDIATGCRPASEHEAWMKKCPLDRFTKQLLDNSALTRKEMDRIKSDIDKKLDAAIAFGKSGPDPSPSELFDHVW
jgi:TPP-dependent pyruvate/acetoin dehydrogenase alpha subunit